MTAYGSKIDLLFQDAPVIESTRQWIVLVLTIFLNIICGHAVFRLFKTQRRFTFDCFVISIEAFKVFLFFLYEFAFDHLILLMIVFIVQTTLRAVVCANFFNKALVIIDRQKWVRPFQIIYYGVILSVVTIILLLCLTLDKTINCDEVIFSYHWFILDALDLIQSLLILLSAVFIVKNMKKQMLEQEINLSSLSYEMKNMHCLQAQTKFLAGFYLVYVITDFMLMGIGNSLFESQNDFRCQDGVRLIPINNSGAAFLLIYTLFLLSFTLMIWFIFFKLPDHYGLISRQKRLGLEENIKLGDSTIESLITISQSEALIMSSPRIDEAGLNRKRLQTDVPLNRSKSQLDSNTEYNRDAFSNDVSDQYTSSDGSSNLGGINRSSFSDSDSKRNNSNLRSHFKNKALKMSMNV